MRRLSAAATARCVLVVDDDADVCWALDRLLQGEGFTVLTVGSGAEALAALKETVFRVILVDAKLADIEGIDLAQRIQAETPSKAPLILVSGYFYADDKVVQECLGKGLFSTFVTKPFLHEDLRRAVRKALWRGAGVASMECLP
ncbi:MAG: response regulator [Acidobacteria bacterium]|nr:response regulator [Acidobacteriota bacterium]